MPNMRGDEFARELLSMRPGLRIVFATGTNQSDLKMDLATLPHQVFLQKPYTGQALRDAVKTALNM